MSTTKTSGSVCQMAYESIDLIQQLTSQSGPSCFRNSKTMELFSHFLRNASQMKNWNTLNMFTKHSTLTAKFTLNSKHLLSMVKNTYQKNLDPKDLPQICSLAINDRKKWHNRWCTIPDWKCAISSSPTEFENEWSCQSFTALLALVKSTQKEKFSSFYRCVWNTSVLYLMLILLLWRKNHG